jgi:hypothetical protein
LNTIPWSSNLTAVYRLNVGGDIWYQVNYNGKNGWIGAFIGGTTYANNTNCNLPTPYPTNWPQTAQIEPNEIPAGCNIDAYFQSEPPALLMARVAFGEAGVYNQVISGGGDTTGGAVFSDAVRVSWIIRMDAFLGLPNYASGVAGRSVSIASAVLQPNSFQPITDLKSQLASNGCNPAGITTENVRKMVYPINSANSVELYQLWIIYQTAVGSVITAPWTTMPNDTRGFDQFKGAVVGQACPAGANNLTRPGSGFSWAANQPFPPKQVYSYLDPVHGVDQQSRTCYQDVYHLDDWLWNQLTNNPNFLSNPATNTFPQRFCAVVLVNPNDPNDRYTLAQLTGLDGQPWPPGTCNPIP